ncbi:MAG TPA: DNA polymerase III subunit delta [Candidatus Polarisedimenticolia bacterium]|nr:DNA polymerase III subunit delta [Candidatus Polarisedimenticolia bacterium]
MPRLLPFARLQAEIKKGAIEPVYLFAGGETWFHEEGIRLLEAAAEAEPINQDRLRGREIGIEPLLDMASTYPMGPGRRLIVVRQAAQLEPEGIEALKAYLARPNPRTLLIFSDAEFDQRRAIWKALEATALQVRCDPIASEAGLAAWVRERLRERGYGIGPELAEAIAVGLGGAGLGRVAAEMDKLMGAIGAPRPVEPADLGILADVPRVADAFQIATLALRGDRGAAIRGARALLDAGEEPPQILGAIAWYVRTALKVRSASDRRVAPRDLMPLYGLPPGRIERFRAEIGALSPAALERAVRLCARADREIKGGGARDRANAFERLLHSLARVSRPGVAR